MYPVNKVLKATVRLSAIYSYIAIIRDSLGGNVILDYIII